MFRQIRLASLAIVFVLLGNAAFAETAPVEIPYEKFVLDNGLTLIVHEDRKAPIVAVNLWYHVGSKNEKVGRTGFAHLFEHLMFNGSENYNDDWFKMIYRIGATDVNGTTSFDRTNYFQNVPATALDTALWLESDRMGHLLGAIDQARLDEQRGVVQNEKRQGENQPYGKVFSNIFENLFPVGHPYSWMIIGSMEDLEAASLEDVKEWFRTYYGPDNTVLVIAGDIDAQTALAKVKQYFGAIPPGPTLTKPGRWIPERTGTQRETMQDRVPQARLHMAWVMPEWGSADADYLQLAAGVLGQGKNSRLYERLVYKDQIATDVSAFAYPLEIAGVFFITATAQPGQDLAALEQAVNEELNRFLDKGPTKQELDRVRIETLAGFVRGVERVGGFGGKSDVLAESQVFGGSPDAWKLTIDRINGADKKMLQDAARTWLSDGRYVLDVIPLEKFAASGEDADRTTVPEPQSYPEVAFPEFRRGQLSNGLQVVVVSRPSIPVVDFDLLVDSGYAADQSGVMGVTSLAMNMMDEGTARRSSLEISEQLSMLGANLGTGANLDVAVVSLSALKDKLEASLDIFADVALNPVFPEDELDRLRKQQLAGIQREKVTPFAMALRVFPKLLYGSGHAYALPFSGSGTEESVASISRADLANFHQTWFRPNNATMVVVGDTTLEEIIPKLEKYFGKWTPAEVPEKNIAQVKMPEAGRVYVIDRPESEQSIIFAGGLVEAKANANETGIEAANKVLGGDFTSRLNLNLREDKHWSYGARSVLVDTQAQRPFIAYAPVQSDKSVESIAEIAGEFAAIRSDRPPTEEEIAEVKDESIRALPGRWETNGAVAGDLIEVLRFGLPEDYWDRYPGMIRNLTAQDVEKGAGSLVEPATTTWVIVGDRKQIEPGLAELGLGEIHYIDADGNPLD
jgi:zinc protease